MIQKLIQDHYNEAVKVRRELHRFPELGHQELRTTERIRQFLEAAGIEILEYPLKTGIVARICGKGQGETLAVREDIDALPMEECTGLRIASCRPGISHACGHDIHTAILLLTAKVLNELKEQFHGTLLLIFQPAEETCDGARGMLQAGVLKRHPADQIVGLHCSPSVPLGRVGIIAGENNASCDIVKITITGRGGHGAHPEDCVDPLMAAGFLLTQIQTLISRETSPMKPAVLTFGQLAAGTAPNIIPDQAFLCGTLRTLDAKVRGQLLEAIPRMAGNCCRAMRAECRTVFENGMPPLVNDPGIAAQFAEAAEKSLGVGAAVRLTVPSMGSDDFSCLLEQCGRGGQFLIGTFNPSRPETGIGLHNSKNVFPDETIGYGAAVLCRYALDTLM